MPHPDRRKPNRRFSKANKVKSFLNTGAQLRPADQAIMPDNSATVQRILRQPNSIKAPEGRRLELDFIRDDGGTQSRAQLDAGVIEDYAEALREGVGLPAVTVFYDGKDYWLADGFHRVHAARKAGLADFPADVRQGSQRDAVLYSVGANASHGLRRTNSDKRRAVERLLRDEEWSAWSMNRIAQQCGVAVSFVSKLKKEVSLFSEKSETRYTTKYGTEATMNTANIGSKPSVKPALPDDAPLFIQDAVDAGAAGVVEGKQLHDLLRGMPKAVQDCAERYSILNAEKLGILKRLHTSAGSPETNGTFEEIAASGGFHYGDDLDKWCDFQMDGVEAIQRGLQSIAKHHAREAMQGKEDATTLPTNLTPLMTSDTPEWYTPPGILQYVVRVLGEIDLDPCSNSAAAPNVPAKRHYTAEDDGLTQPWVGRVFMNPPYGRELVEWVGKVIREYEAGNVSQALLLLPARTDTQWFGLLRQFPRCFVSGRLKFSDSENGAPFPNVVVSIGCDRARFIEVFSEVGDVYELAVLS